MTKEEKTRPKIDLGYVTIYLIKPQIVCTDYQTEEFITVEKGIKIIEEIKTLVGDTPHAIIPNLSNLYTPFKEYFKFLVSERTPAKDKVIARAIVSTNLASRIEMQNFINFFKPQIPTKLFTSVEEAVAWIEPQIVQMKVNLKI
ncbi:MAG: DUF7793 family protein [Bacteroidia bacterium]